MSELLLLQKEDVNLKSINKELAISKGLIIDDDYTNYFYVQSLYRKAFEKFLSLNINLNKYENQIIQSNLDFGILTKEKRNVFFKTSYLNLNYIYVRNLFFVEKLDIKYIKKICDRLNHKDYEIDNELLKIVSKTYKSIINDNYKHKIYKENTTTCYGSVVPSNIVDSKALVLVIQYGKNIEKKVDDEFVKNIMEKEYFLTELIKQMENEISNILDTKCKVLIKTLSEE